MIGSFGGHLSIRFYVMMYTHERGWCAELPRNRFKDLKHS